MAGRALPFPCVGGPPVRYAHLEMYTIDTYICRVFGQVFGSSPTAALIDVVHTTTKYRPWNMCTQRQVTNQSSDDIRSVTRADYEDGAPMARRRVWGSADVSRRCCYLAPVSGMAKRFAGIELYLREPEPRIFMLEIPQWICL